MVIMMVMVTVRICDDAIDGDGNGDGDGDGGGGLLFFSVRLVDDDINSGQRRRARRRLVTPF